MLQQNAKIEQVSIAEGAAKANAVVWEYILVGMLMILCLLLFFGTAIQPAQVLSAADTVFTTPVFADQMPAGYTKPANPLLFDQVYQFTPWRHFAWASLRSGQLPLWNPYSFTGAPLVATMQSAVFYPINLLLTPLPFTQTFVWSAILRLWIAGFFTYALTRRYGLHISACLIAALSFMFCGFLIVWLGHPHTNVAVWLPALILLAEMMVQSRRIQTMIPLMASLALMIGVQFTGGHIETSVDILFAFGLYYLIRWFQVVWPSQISWGRKLRHLFLFPFVSVILGVGLGAVQLLPFLEWLPLSAEFQQRTATSFKLIDPIFVRHLLSLPVLLFPDLFNNPTWEYPYWAFLLRWSNYNELILYVGTLPLLMAIVAIAASNTSKYRPVIRLWIIVGLICLGRAFHLPGFDWLSQLPGFSLGNPERLRLIVSFSLCILAAFGVQRLVDPAETIGAFGNRLWLRLCGAVAVLAAIMMVGSNLVLPLVHARITAYGRGLVETEYAARATHTHPIEHYYAEIDQMVMGLVSAFRPQNVMMYAPALWALGGLAVFVYLRRSDRAHLLQPALLGLVVADLYLFGHGYNPSVPTTHFYPTHPAFSELALEPELFRTTALRQDLVPDSHIMLGMYDFRGLDFPTQWYNQYLNLVASRMSWLSYGAIFSDVDSPLLQALNLKYVIAATPEVLNRNPAITDVRQVGQVYIGEMAAVQPRGYMVYGTVIARSDQESQELLRSEPDAVFHRVVLNEMPGQPVLPIDLDKRVTPSNKVTMLDYKPNRSVWQVQTSHAGYLFVSDSYYPGWRAYMDGEATSIYRSKLGISGGLYPKKGLQPFYSNTNLFPSWRD